MKWIVHLFKLPIHSIRIPRRIYAWIAVYGIVFVCPLSSSAIESPSELFEKKVFPLLKTNCFECHGQEVQHGELRLDAKSVVLKGGKHGPAVVAGKPDQSVLLQRLTSGNEQLRMPLGKEPLKPEEIEWIRSWINQGAPWPDNIGESVKSIEKHWAFIPPAKPEPPKTQNNDWIKNPIDAFVLDKMRQEGFSPSPKAERKKLIRRMYLDTIGLPPNLEELDKYTNDRRPDWDRHLINDLLASPHYGEKWARHWLDAVRYADTNGYEKDRPREIWAYRDYVIDSLNQDKPFDQFTIEQIAGDLLPNAGLDQLVATGYHRNTMHNEEGGVDVEEFRFESIVDRVSTTSTVFLGLTVACAQCHTHKYDPITQKEYYQFFAYFNNCDEVKVKIPDDEVDKERRKVKQSIQSYLAKLDDRFPPFNFDDQWISDEDHPPKSNNLRLQSHFYEWLHQKRKHAVEWLSLQPQTMDAENHTLLKTLPDQSILAYGDMPNSDVYTVTFDSPIQTISAFKLSMLRHPDLPGDGPGRGTVLQDGNFMLSEIKAEIVSGGEVIRNATFASAKATTHAKNATAGNAIDNNRNTGWSIQKHPLKLYQALFNLEEPIHLNSNEHLRVTFDQNYIHTYTMGRFRLSVSNQSTTQPTGLPDALESILHAKRKLNESEISLLRFHFLLDTPELDEQHKELASLIDSMPSYPTSLIVKQRDVPRATKLHHRGEYLQPRDPVKPGVVSVLHPIEEIPESEPPRLRLAKWIVSKDNPLTARVTVNRVWMRYFGRGLVETVDDFGTRGSKPSHPELLDWLAVEFMNNGWSMKHIHRLILTSSTYQQSSKVNPQLLENDPNNEWYARGPRFRLDGELIRDVALSVSGLLHGKIGGPSVFPPLPDGLGALSYGGLKWYTDTDENRYRRGLYTYWKRTNPYPMLTTFDAPPADTACVRRNRSNTPLQALTLLNDTVFLEASQALAYRVLTEAEGTLSDKLRYAFELCTARQPTRDEAGSLLRYYGKQYLRIHRGEIQPAADPIQAIDLEDIDPTQWRAWTMLARVLLNLDETITKE